MFFLDLYQQWHLRQYLAVVSGLTLAGASAIGRDLFVYVIKKGNTDEKTELKVSKVSSVVIG